MITDLNLATRPFRSRALPYMISAVLLVAAALGLIVSLAQLRQNSNSIEMLAARNAEAETEINGLKGQGAKVQQQLTPEQRSILEASHKLVDNKQFGWSRLFADLENVLPGSVSASRISVQNIYNDSGRLKAELELGVLSRDYPSVMKMIENMHNSGLFQAELRGQDLQQNERVTFTEYTLRLVYSPTYGYSTSTDTDVAQNSTGGGQ